MTQEPVLTPPTDEKPKRTASLKVRMAKMSLNRDMWDGTHEIEEANHEFFLARFFSDVLHVFNDAKEAVDAVKEAFVFEESRSQREKEEQADQLLLDPEMAAIIQSKLNGGASSKATKTPAKVAAK